jgi:hypothetical protein
MLKYNNNNNIYYYYYYYYYYYRLQLYGNYLILSIPTDLWTRSPTVSIGRGH